MDKVVSSRLTGDGGDSEAGSLGAITRGNT